MEYIAKIICLKLHILLVNSPIISELAAMSDQLPTQERRPGLLGAILTLKCPRCRRAPLFINQNPYVLKSVGKMPPTCPNCNQDFVIEPGFYFGAMMFTYIIQVFAAALIGLAMYAAGVRKANHYIIPISALILLTSPYVLCISRAIWLSLFVRKQEG